MPAIFDSLVRDQGLPAHKAWRVAYIVPFILIVAAALGMLFTCDDTPTGKWSERHIWMKEETQTASKGNIVDLSSGAQSSRPSGPPSIIAYAIPDVEKKGTETPLEPQSQAIGQLDAFRADAVASPSRKEAFNVIFSLATMAVAVPYACSFGSELAINSILGDYYDKNFPYMGQTQTGEWAAMFGFLNIVCRPAGGFLADFLYRKTNTPWAKKLLLSFLGVVMGAFMIAMGLSDPKSEATMFGLTAGLAFFLESCNGAIFSLVPHVHPYANGMLFPTLRSTLKNEIQVTNSYRDCLRHGRWVREPRRYHLRHHLPLQSPRLRAWHLDSRCYFYGRVYLCLLGSACAEKSDEGVVDRLIGFSRGV
jgi:NNP family nitrate/nitrite transporter-like MFS transporter